MKRIKNLGVYYHGRRVGTLALYKSTLAAFQYDKDWIHTGFSISPFSLPLRDDVFIPKADPFEGLFGVFADSLPDGWGRLLVDRYLVKNHINPYETGNLDRLSIVGETGMGALTYRPDWSAADHITEPELDRIADDCRRILVEEDPSDLDALFRLGGSSGGARPKILTKIDGEDWIIKFPSNTDRRDIGLQEYEYSVCAKACGIEMEETRLFPSKYCEGYFGTRRFDVEREGSLRKRVHMVSAAGLLETSHRIPNLDYDTLMRLTMILTKDYTEIEKLYRRMCFNVYAHNRDDHSKNFSYLYNEDKNRWILSPAYDLTYSFSFGGEHATTVNGNGADPDKGDLLAVADNIGMNHHNASETADEIRELTEKMLGQYLR